MARQPPTTAQSRGLTGAVLRSLSILALLAYPFAVYFGLERFGPTVLAIALGILLLLRLAAGGQLGAPGHAPFKPSLKTLGLVLMVALFITAAVASGDDRVLKAYPVLINLGLLVLFALSLVYPPTVPERGMRLAGQAVPEEARSYLWWVTLAWCGFFLCNGLVAAWTALFAPLAYWTVYNGLLSYLLIGVFFAAEYGVRTLVKRRHARGQDAND